MLKKLFMITACAGMIALTGCSKKEDVEPVEDETSIVEENTDNSTVSDGDIELTAYQLQSVVSSINSRLSELYEVGTYGWVTSDSITLERNKDGNLVATTEINRTEGENKYTVPAEFELVFNHSSNTYSVVDGTVESDKAVTIDSNDSKGNSSSNLSKTQPPTTMNEQDSFEINVSSGISITLDLSAGGHGAAYAQADDGTYTLLCDAQDEEKTESVTLPAGHYTVRLYSEDGVSWGWSYNVQ